MTERANKSEARARLSARRRRWLAARRFKPDGVQLLLVAKAPPGPKPGERDRYFYYLDVDRHDDLFIEVAWALLAERRREPRSRTRCAGSRRWASF